MSLDHSICNSIVLHNILYYNSKMEKWVLDASYIVVPARV